MSTDFWHHIEIAVIGIVIFIQIIHSIRVYLNISKLKNIFTFKLFLRTGFIEKGRIGRVDIDSTEIHYEDRVNMDEDSLDHIPGVDMVKLSLIDTKGSNNIITTIKVAINTYLINNYGAAVNFSIIKDIVDREIEVKDEEITQSITLPLYLGLAATMTGIIFGLFSMPELDGNGFSEGVNALIGGVKIAMIGSLSGLVCTTWLSSFSYKRAKRIVQKDKNEQLTYLQAKLLPELIKAEETGVSGLKASLDRFARVATSISDNVLIAANQTGENLVLQQDVMDKIENMEVLKISKWNMELFDKLDHNMDAFNKFSGYLSSMEKISSNLLKFSARTSNIDLVIKQIDSTLSESKRLSQFLSAHFDKIEASGSAALKSVGLAQSHFEDAIGSLKTRTDEMINQLYSSAGNHEASLENIYKEIESNLNQITTKYISLFSDAYSESIPKFDQLENLNLLPEIKSESNAKVQILVESVRELNASLKSVQTNFNSHAITTTLCSIDENLKKQQIKNNSLNSNQIKPNGSGSKKDSSRLKNEPLTLRKALKNLF